MFGLFESIHIIGQTLVKNFIELLDNYALRKKNIVYVKDEGSNLNSEYDPKINCKLRYVGFGRKFEGTCFGHSFSKACQYATIEENVC
jgi:hypothetical protein